MKSDAIFDPAAELPEDWRSGLFVGRIDRGEGPSPVLLRAGRLFDIASSAPTVSDLLEDAAAARLEGEDLGDLASLELSADACAPLRLLSPLDLQCVKAAGVTFAVSTLERVIEERAGGDADKAEDIRARLEHEIGSGLQSVIPGSDEAAALKTALMEAGLWSQYLEVAIGPYAEIFTKAPVLSAIGWGADIGVRSDSGWNNPEPEIVIIADSKGGAVGATLGNDVNLRDLEGRSALLLGKAKDNNASCAVGPFIRLFDDRFSMDDVRRDDVSLRITGEDGFSLEDISSMSKISRDPGDLLRQCFNQHQYPDGAALFLGTMFAPTKDRDGEGGGFTHKEGDRVEISSEKLGRLVNRVTTCDAAPPWEFGLRALMQNLAKRNLIRTPDRKTGNADD
ncbi:fumarylacetoacetate hydrolase family protein [Hyphococcus luteus]|uniref:Fumarylacetoacetate hydrolase n=1 Tax=Hyphococcus luteus TaxID=2058213 RepID=A0A2S7KBH4_9PROT|nr:fumarylacetoacetate hydrolase family protein [Marinicaulis flavus]PQA89779.1 fumarylacetoacetate hydrolase [Marinicaulis flavus]